MIWLVCLTLFSLSVGTAPTSASSVLMLAACLFGGCWHQDRDWWRQQRPWLIPVLLVMLLPWVSLLWTIEAAPQLFPYLQRTYFWLLSFATACLLLPKNRPEYLAGSFIAGVELTAVVFFCVLTGLIKNSKLTEYFLFRGYITFSLLLVVATALLSFWFRQSEERRKRYLFLGLIGFNLVALALLKGRSGYLALVVVAPLVAFNLMGKQRWWIYLSGILTLIVVLALSPTVRQRITLIAQETTLFSADATRARATSIGKRLMVWEGGVKIFQEHPVLGVGIDGYPVAMRRIYPDLNETIHNPHNFYIYVAASYGLLGVALYGWLWFVLFQRAWGHRNSWQGFMLLSTLLVVSIGSLTETTPLQPQTGILLAIMAGLPLEG